MVKIVQNREFEWAGEIIHKLEEEDFKVYGDGEDTCVEKMEFSGLTTGNDHITHYA